MFHWTCAEARYRALPRTTAPAGYQCPSCATPVFPPPNLVSPVAEELREKLAGVNWARAGLGLPLVSNTYLRPNNTIRSSSTHLQHLVVFVPSFYINYNNFR